MSIKALTGGQGVDVCLDHVGGAIFDARTELARLLGEAGHGPEAREQLVLAVRRFKAQSAPGVDVLEATLRRVKG